MKQWPGATLPRNCSDCGREYLVSTVEVQQCMDDVCRECWEAFDGVTIDDLIDADGNQDDLSSPSGMKVGR